MKVQMINPPADFSRHIAALPEPLKTIASDLVSRKRFQSDFFASLYNQLILWARGANTHAVPFSPRQLECLISSYAPASREIRKGDTCSYYPTGCDYNRQPLIKGRGKTTKRQ
jgi:hypothetical protein